MAMTIQLRGDPSRSDAHFYVDRSEEHLLSASRAGDSYAFSELCRRYIPIVKYKIMRIVRNREDAEDVLQDTLLKAFKYITLFRGTCKFQTWLIRIGINSSFMLLRKRKAKSRFSFESNYEDTMWYLESSVPDSAPNPEQECVREQALGILAQSLARLPDDCRSLLDHYYSGGCPLSRIAVDFGITEAAAKSRLLRARRLLRERQEGQLSSGG
jgi:RNA polymerase sigma-70 factor, ECF subfamily